MLFISSYIFGWLIYENTYYAILGDVEIMLKKLKIYLYDKFKNHLELISVVPKAGLEPALREETDFESVASTNSAIRA